MRVPLAVAACLLAVAIGCGGDDGDGDKAAATTAQREISAEDQRRAEAATLELGDFPDGWRGSPPEDDDEDSCTKADLSSMTITGEHDSNEFTESDSEDTTVDSGTKVFAAEDEARRSLELLAESIAADEVEQCLKDAVENQTDESELKVGEVDVGELSFVSPAGVDEGRAWQVVVPIEVLSGPGEGLEVESYVELFALRTGDMVVQLRTTDVGSPFDEELRNELLKALAERMTSSDET